MFKIAFFSFLFFIRQNQVENFLNKISFNLQNFFNLQDFKRLRKAKKNKKEKFNPSPEINIFFKFLYTHRLNVPDNFENRRSANDENEKADQPRGRRIFIFLRFQRFLNIPPGRYVFRINFVGDSTTLRSWHFFFFSFLFTTSRKNYQAR